MQKISEFLKRNSIEVFSVGTLLFIFAFLFILFGKYSGNLIIDCGREAYFPQLVLEGKVLYKDILNLYGPLSYQINAIFYKIFGNSFESLRLAGALNAGLTLVLLYSISRFFTSRLVSWIIAVFIAVSCVFSPWIFNYIFSYSFAMTYALSAFLFSVLFLLLYLKKENEAFVPLSWFFLGASLTSKYDYILYAVFLLIFTLASFFSRKLSIKSLISSFASFFIVPIISFSLLFAQGLVVSDLKHALNLLQLYSNTASIKYFYSHYAGLYPQKVLLINSFYSFVQNGLNLLLLFVCGYFSLKLTEYKSKNAVLGVLSGIIFYASLLYFVLHINNFTFSWLPIFVSSILGFAIACSINTKSFSKDLPFLIMVFISLIAASKTLFFLNLGVYGTFSFPLLLVVVSLFTLEYLPDKFSIIDKRILQKTFFIIGLVVTVFLAILSWMRFAGFEKFETKRGVFYGSGIEVQPMQAISDYIDKNVSKDSKIWVIPEGMMLNYVTDRPSAGIYYNTTLTYIEAFKENNIIQDVVKNSPDYVVITSRDSSDYGPAYICRDYGFEICTYVEKNYFPVAKFGEDFVMLLYKKK